jgi:hypothetical protein
MYKLPRGVKVVPDKFITNLDYKGVTVHLNTGSSFCQWRYRTSAYDPDPALGTGALGGYSEIAALYKQYRVLAIEYDMYFANLEAFAQQIVVAPFTSDPGSNTVSGDQMSNETYSQSRILDAKGGQDRTVIKGVFRPQDLFGSKNQYLLGDNYSSIVTTNPATPLYLGVCYASTNGSNMTASNGVALVIKLTYVVEFFQRLALAV